MTTLLKRTLPIFLGMTWLLFSIPAFAKPDFKSVPSNPTTSNEDELYTYNVIIGDCSGSNPKISLTTYPTGMTIGSTNGPFGCQRNTNGCWRYCQWAASISWVPTNAQAEQSHKVIIFAKSANGTNSYVYYHKVNNVNDDPELTVPSDSSTKEDQLYKAQATATDIDPTNDTLSFELLSPPTGMTINKSTGVITWTPTNDHANLVFTIKVRVTDGNGGSDEKSYQLRVINVNDPPVITSTPPGGAVKNQLYVYEVKANDPDPTNDVLTYKLVYFSPTSGASSANQPKIDSSTGRFTWTPAPSDLTRDGGYGKGVFKVKISVSDGKGGSVDQEWFIRVTGKNDPPRITSSPVTGATEDQLYTYSVTATDPNNDKLSFSLITFPKGMAIDKATGKITWTPTNSDVGSHTVKIQVDDGKGGIDTQEYVLTVKNVNDPPEITSSPITITDEDKLYVYQVTAKDIDPTNDRLTFSLVTSVSKMVIDPTTGKLTWTPTNDNANKTYTVTVKVSDGHGGTDSQTFKLRVNNVNDDPVFTSTPVTTATEDSLYKYIITAKDIDPTNDKLSYKLISGPAGMAISNGNLLQWTPDNAAAVLKNHKVVVEVSDGKGGKALQSFIVSVTNVNDPPVITSTAVTGAVAFKPYQYDVEAKDEDPTNDTLTYKLTTFPKGMQINSGTGLIDWSPTLADKGVHPVVVVVTDNHGASTKQSFDVTVVDKNTPPVITSKAITKTTEDKLYTYQIKAKDADGDKLTYILERGPKGMDLDKAKGVLSWTPRNEDVGKHTVTFRVDDNKGGIARQNFTLTVINVNDPPQIISKPKLETTEDTKYTYQVQGKDIDPTNDVLTYKLLTAPKGMIIDSKTGDLTWTPKNADVGNHLVTIVVEDGKGGKASQRFTLVVKNVNDDPVFIAKPITKTKEDALYNYRAEAKDEDPTHDKLTYKLLKAPKGLTIDSNTGVILWTPKNKDVGVHKIEIMVSDGKGGSALQTYALTVINTNDPPKIISKPPTGATQGKEYKYTAKAVDEDPTHDKITFVLTQKPNGMTINPSSGAISWRPRQSDVGIKHLVTLVANDGHGGKDTQSWLIEVFNVNDPPYFTEKPTSQTTPQGKLYQYQVKAKDKDNDPLVYRLTTSPKEMRINPASGLIQWTPNNADVGSHIIVVQVDDGKGGTASLTFGITVTNVNDLPEITSKPVTEATEDQLYTYQVTAKDIDPPSAGDVLTYHLDAAPKGMSINKQNGLIQWTPTNDNANKTYTITIRVTDGKTDAQGNPSQDKQSFTITVKNVNDPPKIVSKAITEATEDSPYLYLVKAEDIDPTKDKLTFSIKVDPPAKGLNIDPASGLIQWTPDNDAAIQGKYNVEITVDDGHQNSSYTQKFILTVKNVNDPPKITSSPITEIVMNQTYSYNVKASDPDPTKDKLTYSLEKAPKSMTIDKDNGLIQWKTTNLDVGQHDVTVKVSDGKGAEDIQSFKINVLVDKGAPVANILPLPLVEPNQIQLDGTASRDPNNKPLKYEWIVESGPDMNVKFDDPTAGKPKIILRRAGIYRFRLVVENPKGIKSKPAYTDVEVKNLPPVANAGRNFAAKVNTEVTLDGSMSDDSNGDKDKLTFIWKQSAGEPVTLTDETTAHPKFTPPKVGLYTFELVVDDGENKSKPSSVTVIVINPAKKAEHPPYAYFEAKDRVVIGESIELDASRSRSLAGKKLKFSWELISGPSKEGLSNAQSAKATFKPIKPGLYRFKLTVQDDVSNSPPVFHTVYAMAADQEIPTAVVSNGYAEYETWYKLDGSNSASTDGSQLTFQWTQIAGPPVVLKDATTAIPQFFVLNKGIYKFKLVTKQKDSESFPAYVTVIVNEKDNKPPVADPGESLTGKKAVMAGKEVSLDGSKSSDPEAKPLTYSWFQVSGIPVVIEKSKEAKPKFIPIAYGKLVFELQVSDGQTLSLPGARVEVVVNDDSNHLPVANAGEDQEVLAGVTVTLDGSKSSDEDGDKLTFKWRQISPTDEEAQVKLDDDTAEKPSFKLAADTKVNEFVFGLVVDDGKFASAEDTVVIKVIGVNEAPKVVIKKLPPVKVNATVVLDGSGSSDPNTGDKLTFKWKQTGGGNVTLKDADKAKASFVAKQAGTYKFVLTVSDGTLESTGDITVIVKPDENLEPAPGGCGCYTSNNSSAPTLPLSFFMLLLFFLISFRRRR